MPSRDRFLQRRWSSDHYERNKDAYKARATAQRRDRQVVSRGIIRKAKDVPCMDCGQRYPSYVMQFDHVRGVKLFDVGAFAATNRPLPHLHKEIAKCEVVCANCHAERTHRRRLDKLAGAAADVDPERSGAEVPSQPALFLETAA